MNRQEHLAFEMCNHIMLNPRCKHQQTPGLQIVRRPLGRDPQMSFQHLNGNQTIGAMRRQACESAKHEKRNGIRPVFIKGGLPMTRLTRLQFTAQFFRDLGKVERMLLAGKALLGMGAKTFGRLRFHETLRDCWFVHQVQLGSYLEG